MIYDILPVNNYQGNGNSTTFDFDFYIEDKSQLNVFRYDAEGLKTQLAEGVDYSINEIKNKNGSYITFPIQGSKYSVLAQGEMISLELTLPVSQETQYNNSSLLNLETLEYSLDYLTRLIQILARKVELCVKVDECSSDSPEELIDIINSKALSTKNSSSEAQEALNDVLELKSQVSTISQNILQNGEKFEQIDANQLQIVQINTALNSKASTSLANISQEAKELISSFSVPDYKNGVAGQTLNNTWKTVDYDCLVKFYAKNSAANLQIVLDLKDEDGNIVASENEERFMITNMAANGGGGLLNTLWAVIPKGYSYKCYTSVTFQGAFEYPLKGAN